MNLDDLQLLVRIDELRSIRAAARAIGLDASLATRRLGAMEARLGVRLFLRTTRRLETTEAGQLYLEWAREALSRFGDTQDAVGALKEQPIGVVRIACPELLAVRYMGVVARDLATRYPQLQLSILATDRAISLPDENFDAAVFVTDPPQSRLILRKLLDVELLMCAAPAYLAERGEPKTPADLLDHRLISHSYYDRGLWHFARGKSIESIPVHWHVRTEGTLLSHVMALEGVGIARLTRRTVDEDLRKGRLVQVLPRHRCVLPDGSGLAAWVAFPDRKVLYRTRVVVDALVQHLRE
jgi:DNA-binding transcriptional LysR family regulator